MRNPNNYGSVFKMSGKRRNSWRVRKMTGRTPEGKPIYTNVGYTKTRAEGMLLLASFNSDPWDIGASTITFKEVMDMYIENDKRDLKANTIKGRNLKIRMCTPIHDAPMKDLKTIHLQKLIDDLDVAAVTKLGVQSFMRQIFTYAMQNDIVDRNYADFIQIDMRSQKELKRKVFTPDEINKIMKQDGIRYDILKVLLFTGFRITELLEIETANVNLEEGYLKGGNKTHSGIDRVVPISRHVVSIIAKYYDSSSTFLFTEKNDKAIQYQTYQSWFKKYVEGDHVIHNTRHTFVSLISETDADKLSIKNIIGHASHDITERVYTHKSVENLREAMNKFDDHVAKFL